jgi:transcription initiation factor TFIIH subunit 3
MSSDRGSLLCVVLDCNPVFWGRRKANKDSGDSNFSDVLATLLVFLNAHLTLHRDNTLAVLAANAGKSRFLFPADAGASGCAGGAQSGSGSGSASAAAKKAARRGDAARFATVQAQIVDALRKIPVVDSDDEDSNASLGGSLSMALCLINRRKRERPGLQARVLVVSVSADVSWQYVGILNCVFCAQKLGCPVDACVLSGEDSCFLQQASHITRGVYLRIQRQKQRALLQFLLSVFLPDPDLRRVLSLPAQKTVDFRAVCFCHHRLVSSAYVCSACLSIFCEPKDACPTCGTESVRATADRSLVDICSEASLAAARREGRRGRGRRSAKAEAVRGGLVAKMRP